MKRNGIINADISRVMSYMGHTDTIAVGDCGLPIPDETERIDLAPVSYTHLDVYKRQVGGFVDSEFANRFMNRIPVVYEPVKEMGYEAGGMILKKIEENQEFRVKALKCIYQSNHFGEKE